MSKASPSPSPSTYRYGRRRIDGWTSICIEKERAFALTESEELPGGGCDAPDEGDGEDDGGVVGGGAPQTEEQHQAQVEQEGDGCGGDRKEKKE